MPEGLLKDMFAGKYVLMHPDGHLVGTDSMSGALPYKAATPAQVRFFPDRQAAEKYRKFFPNAKLSLHEVKGLQIMKERFSR